MIKHSSGISSDELSLIDAAVSGRQAGMFGHGASLNPYQAGSLEYAEWEKYRITTIGARLNGHKRVRIA